MTTTLDLLALIRGDTRVSDRQSATTNGGEYKAACPLPGCNSSRDALCIWPNHPSGRPRWWCRACGRGGDAIAWLVEMGRISKKEAAELRRGGDLPSCGAGELLSNTRRAAAPAPVLPPGPDWQAAARAFVATCQAALWSEAGGRALAWLRGRGLADETIRAAGLGYNPAPRDPDGWAWSTWGEKRVKLYRGIVIPWEVAGDLWRVNIRRPAGDPKYYSPAGWANGLYNAGELARDRPALLVEGEIDALTVGQVAGDLITPVALGSTSGARRPRWIVPLAACPLVLVALDADLDPNKGARAAAWWVDVLPNAKRWRPWWGDANAMHQDGADLRAWISAGLPVANNSGPAHQVGTPALVSKPSTSRGAELPAEPAAALPCTLEAWPDLAARWGGSARRATGLSGRGARAGGRSGAGCKLGCNPGRTARQGM